MSGRQSWMFALLLIVGVSFAAETAKGPFSPRIRDLASRLTLDEKLALTDGSKDPADGGEAGYLGGIPRHLPERSLCFWSESTHTWVPATGVRRLTVGDSSRNEQLTQSANVPPLAKSL